MANNKNFISMIGNDFYFFVKLIMNISKLVVSEAALAKQSLIYFLLLLVFLLPLLIVFWASIIFSIFIILHAFSLSWQSSFFILSIFNIAVLAGVLWLLIGLKNNLLFSATRRQLKNMMSGEGDA